MSRPPTEPPLPLNGPKVIDPSKAPSIQARARTPSPCPCACVQTSLVDNDFDDESKRILRDANDQRAEPAKLYLGDKDDPADSRVR